MEELSSTLKESFSTIPAKILNYSSRLILSNNLDFKHILPSKKGYPRDYRGLGELMGLEYNTIKIFERSKESPTHQILETWETRVDSTVEKLLEILEEMERYDIIKELLPSLVKTVNIYLENRKVQEIPIQDPEVSSCPLSSQPERDTQVFTVDDIKSGECTYYHAYVAYADEDCHFVQELARILESPEIGLKLFIRGRDLLAGFTEHATNIKLIKERCQRMLIILSPNFLKSPSCEFQASFAAALAIDQQQRMLIPIVYAPCETPLILKYVSKIDFTKPDVQEWVWGKLISSLLPEVQASMFTPSLHRLPLQKGNAQKAAQLPSVKSSPMITFPTSSKHVLNNPTSAPTTSVQTVPETSAKVASKTSTKKWMFPWNSHFKGRSSNTDSSSHSVSYSSGVTSGFHSQSENTLESLDSSVEDCAISNNPV